MTLPSPAEQIESPERRERMNPLARGFFDRLNGHSIPKIAEKIGISDKTIYGWKANNSPNVTTLEAALNSIGYELQICPRQNAKRLADDPGYRVAAEAFRIAAGMNCAESLYDALFEIVKREAARVEKQ
jgi:hypothetical protein